jgi:hypothetical protein
MRALFSRMLVCAFLSAVALGVATTASAQSCLGIDACLLSPTRTDNGRPITPNGCSVPPEAGALGQFWGGVFATACNQHDIDWGTYKADVNAWFTQSNAGFLANMLAICRARTDLPASQCQQAANLFFLAVSTTSIAQDIFKRSQYFSSSCACQQLPTAPTNLTSQITPGAGGAQVRLQWTPGADATSYAVEVVQPPLAPIDTGSPQPVFTANGVPNGQYRVQVRAVNPLGVSGPSNVADLIVGTAGPCAPPAAPSRPNTSFANGVAGVNWSGVAGATSYIVRAGTGPNTSNLFDGNVGSTTAVSAAGLPPGFRAFVRVYAVNACGVSAASPEATIGG